MIYRHKTVHSLIKRGMSMGEVADEAWIAMDKGYIDETPSGFRLTVRGIEQYCRLKLAYTDASVVQEYLQRASDKENVEFIPLMLVV